MRVIGKVRPDRTIIYRVGDWVLHFGPSVGNQGQWFVHCTNPRGWGSLDWVATRRDVFPWFDRQVRRYAELFPA